MHVGRVWGGYVGLVVAFPYHLGFHVLPWQALPVMIALGHAFCALIVKTCADFLLKKQR